MSMAVIGIFASDKGPGDPERASLMSQTGTLFARRGAQLLCLWEQGVEGLDNYNQLRKVEPMRRALDELAAGTWFTGLRRSQSASRADTPVLQWRGDRLKVSPIADWSDRDVWQYLKRHDLPYHPLWHEGYVSIGDFHTTTRWEPGMKDEDTRFFGLKRECGIHEDI